MSNAGPVAGPLAVGAVRVPGSGGVSGSLVSLQGCGRHRRDSQCVPPALILRRARVHPNPPLRMAPAATLLILIGGASGAQENEKGWQTTTEIDERENSIDPSHANF